MFILELLKRNVHRSGRELGNRGAQESQALAPDRGKQPTQRRREDSSRGHWNNQEGSSRETREDSKESSVRNENSNATVTTTCSKLPRRNPFPNFLKPPRGPSDRMVKNLPAL